MIAVLFGTRPEAIKLGPVVAALRESERVQLKVLCTGQHTDLLKGTPAEGDLKDAESLGLASAGGVARWLTRGELACKTWLAQAKPTLVVVQGDTMSAAAGATAAASLGLPIAHVEAGVRSGDLDDPWPEERLRRGITQRASLHLAPTEHAKANLLAEGVPAQRLFVTGNPVVSALARYTDAAPRPEAGPTILVTLHRRELHLRGAAAYVLGALWRWAAAHDDMQLVWPVHPSMRGVVSAAGTPPRNLVLLEPIAYAACAHQLAASRGVLTDSGGLSEEAATLGVPCVILRHANDRPEAVAAGVARQYNPTSLGTAAALDALALGALPRQPSECFGEPNAGLRVAHELLRFHDALVRLLR